MDFQADTLFLGIIATVALAAIPWAHVIHGRVCRLEARLESLAKSFDRWEHE